MGLCSLSQRNFDTSQLFTFQLRLATRSTRTSQCAPATTLPLLVPATYALATYLQFSGNPRQDHLASGKQSGRLLPSLCHCPEIPTLSKVSLHANILTQSQRIVTVLCEIQ
jgi:hypothetical protein